MSVLSEGSKWPKIAALVMFLTLLTHMISMGAPDWAKADDTVVRRDHIGLWRYCTDTIGGGQRCNAFVDIIVGDWLKAAQSFCILALFAMMGAMAVVALLAFVPDFGEDSRLLLIGITVTGIAALFKLVEVATFGATYQEYFKNKDPGVWGEVGQLSWAFYIAVVSLFLNFCTVVLLVLEMINGGKDSY